MSTVFWCYKCQKMVDGKNGVFGITSTRKKILGMVQKKKEGMSEDRTGGRRLILASQALKNGRWEKRVFWRYKHPKKAPWHGNKKKVGMSEDQTGGRCLIVASQALKNGRWEKRVFWCYKCPHILPRSIRNSSFGTVIPFSQHGVRLLYLITIERPKYDI